MGLWRQLVNISRPYRSQHLSAYKHYGRLSHNQSPRYTYAHMCTGTYNQ